MAADLDLVRTLGIDLLTVTAEEVVAEMEIAARHLQGVGVVHGGVHCALIETAASLGAYEFAKSRGDLAPFGMELNASYLRAAQKGCLRVRATPIARGRTTQVWEATVQDAQGRPVAIGRVRFLNGAPQAPERGA